MLNMNPSEKAAYRLEALKLARQCYNDIERILTVARQFADFVFGFAKSVTDDSDHPAPSRRVRKAKREGT